jgi:hypothetical protein
LKRLSAIFQSVSAGASKTSPLSSSKNRPPDLLGLYPGHPLTRRSVFQGFTMPHRITIYQGPHERISRTPAELEKMVADTIWHEIAHYFGMDEPQVRRAERNIARLRNRIEQLAAGERTCGSPDAEWYVCRRNS